MAAAPQQRQQLDAAAALREASALAAQASARGGTLRGDAAAVEMLENFARDGHIDAVRVLLDAGADLGNGLRKVFTPNASWGPGRRFEMPGNQVAMVKLLLDCGADASSVNDDGQTLLHEAASGRAPVAVIDMLADAGADINALDAYGQTPLMQAVHRYCPIGVVDQALPEGIRRLLDRGARVDFANDKGETALHLAASAGFVYPYDDRPAEGAAAARRAHRLLQQPRAHAAAHGMRRQRPARLLRGLRCDTALQAPAGSR